MCCMLAPLSCEHAGDVLAVLPRTPDKLVATFLSRLGLEGGQRVRVSVAPGTGHPGQHSQPKVEATVWDLVHVSMGDWVSRK
jgi:sulfite reductase alpha subunit-like flavoprotein